MVEATEGGLMPYTDQGLPFSGARPASRHSSWTGAVHAERHRSANIQKLRALWQEPHTMQEMAELASLPISSVCSLKAALDDELMVVGYAVQVWDEALTPGDALVLGVKAMRADTSTYRYYRDCDGSPFAGVTVMPVSGDELRDREESRQRWRAKRAWRNTHA